MIAAGCSPAPSFASEKITAIQTADPHIHDRRVHRNAHEAHRELRQTPQRAWDQAQKEKRSDRVQRRGALGGILCGACASSSKWAAMVACPSARNAGGSRNLPPPKSCLVFTLQALTPSRRLRPIISKNPCCPSPLGPNEPSCFANSKTFLFENYATMLAFEFALPRAGPTFRVLLHRPLN